MIKNALWIPDILNKCKLSQAFQSVSQTHKTTPQYHVAVFTCVVPAGKDVFCFPCCIQLKLQETCSSSCANII